MFEVVADHADLHGRVGGNPAGAQVAVQVNHREVIGNLVDDCVVVQPEAAWVEALRCGYDYLHTQLLVLAYLRRLCLPARDRLDDMGDDDARRRAHGEMGVKVPGELRALRLGQQIAGTIPGWRQGQAQLGPRNGNLERGSGCPERNRDLAVRHGMRQQRSGEHREHGAEQCKQAPARSPQHQDYRLPP